MHLAHLLYILTRQLSLFLVQGKYCSVSAISVSEQLPNAFWEAHLRASETSTSNPAYPITYTAWNTNVTGEKYVAESKEMAPLDMYSDEIRSVTRMSWSLNSANSTYVNNGVVTPKSRKCKFYIKH